jgi:hypothetical protein
MRRFASSVRSTLRADKALDGLLDDPKALAMRPESAASLLRKQEVALDDLVNKQSTKLRATFAADETGTRAAALDYAQVALEKNRALQAKIAEISAKPASARLEEIATAVDAINAPKAAAKAGIGDMLGDFALGHMVSAATGIPYVGQMVVAGKAIAGVVKKLGVNTAEAAARGSKAIETFLNVSNKVTSKVRAPVLASKVLSSVRYAQPSSSKPAKAAKADTLTTAFKARESEIRSLMQPAPDGTLQMHPVARQKMAQQLAPIRAADPLLADRIETTKARGVEFLAGKLPRRPDVGVKMGPDRWQPSDMEMRTWARYVAAVEDPHGVIERLADGTVTPEDAETMRTVYPEMYADLQAQLMSEIGDLRQSLPYSKRLSLSIFADVAIDPSMDPGVLNILQSTFASEQGSQGGTQAPKANPAFGSVKKSVPEPTPAQHRAG